MKPNECFNNCTCKIEGKKHQVLIFSSNGQPTIAITTILLMVYNKKDESKFTSVYKWHKTLQIRHIEHQIAVTLIYKN